MNFRKLIRRISKEIGLSAPPVEISAPMNFEHRVHVFLDDSGHYVGLPPQWSELIGNKARRKPRRTASSSELFLAARRNTAFRRGDASTGGLQRQNGTLGGSLKNPRSRSSVADDQDLIIERLKRELRDYKMNHPLEFNNLIENSYFTERPLALSREIDNGGSRQELSWTARRGSVSSFTKKVESAV